MHICQQELIVLLMLLEQWPMVAAYVRVFFGKGNGHYE